MTVSYTHLDVYKRQPSKVPHHPFGEGESIVAIRACAGGYGNPFEREVQRVVEDVRNGLVSLEGARLDYGVVITDRDSLTVDQAATARLRAA